MSFGMFRAVGKRGKKQSCPWKEPTDNERNGSAPEKNFIRRNDAGRSLVGAAVARLSGTIDVYRLFNVGCISGDTLLFRQLHLAILFTRDFRRFAAQLVWAKAELVAELAFVFTGAFHPVGAGRISADLLLLPRRILQSILGGPTGMHGRRATQKLLGRALVPAHHAERASLFSLSCADLHRYPHH